MEEHRTAEIVAAKLAEWGIEVHRGIGKTGVVGVLRRGAGGKSIGLRADMDCLPMDEQTNLPYRSRNAGPDARLRPRRPHHHAAGRGALSGGVADVPGHRAFHLPAGRGGRRRRRWPCWRTGCSRGFPAMPGVRPAQPAGPCRSASSRSARGRRRRAARSSTSRSPGRGAHGATPEMSIDPVLVAATSSRRCSRSWRATCRRRTRRC